MTALPIESGQQPGSSRIGALDGVRGLAALSVMLLHFSLRLTPTGTPTQLLRWIFVTGPRLDLFFVLSGFFVTGLLYDSKTRERYFRNFYTRRMLRILPLYYGSLVVLFLVPYLLPGPGAAQFRVPIDDQLWYWFYLQNFRPLPPQFIGLAWHFWSLAIEQQFYLVWPLVILKASREQALRICGALIVISCVYRVFGEFDASLLGAVWPTASRLDPIAVGSAIALIMRGSRGLEPLRRHMLPIFLVAVAYIAAFLVTNAGPIAEHPLFPLYFMATAVFFGCLLIYSMQVGEGIAGSVLRSRVLAFFGKYGYGLYVFHVPLIVLASLAGFYPGKFMLAQSELTAALAYLAGMTAITTVVALISWHIWEKQFLKLKPVLSRADVPGTTIATKSRRSRRTERRTTGT